MTLEASENETTEIVKSFLQYRLRMDLLLLS
jgi:hypothetical protein